MSPGFSLTAFILGTWVATLADANPQYGACAFYDGNRHVILQEGEMSSQLPDSCERYKCLAGNLRKVARGCYNDGICMDVGKTFVGKDCNDYICSMPLGPDVSYYLQTIVKTGCKDYYNACHTPGDRFRFVDGGSFYNDCRCVDTGRNWIVQC